MATKSVKDLVFALPYLTVVYLCFLSRTTDSEIVICSKNETCGYNSLCIGNECVCNEGFTSLVPPVGQKGKNCIDKKCENGQCYTCIDGTRCKRCINFVIEKTGKCTDKCEADDNVSLEITGEYQGNVCKAPNTSTKWTKAQYIGLIVGLCLGAVLIIVIGIVIYIIRRKKMDEATQRQIEEIRAKKRREKEERRKAKAEAEKNSNNREAKTTDKTASGNIRGARDFEV